MAFLCFNAAFVYSIYLTRNMAPTAPTKVPRTRAKVTMKDIAAAKLPEGLLTRLSANTLFNKRASRIKRKVYGSEPDPEELTNLEKLQNLQKVNEQILEVNLDTQELLRTAVAENENLEHLYNTTLASNEALETRNEELQDKITKLQDEIRKLRPDYEAIQDSPEKSPLPSFSIEQLWANFIRVFSS